MISIYYQNVNRIRSKLTQFYLKVLNSNYDLICITETNLNDGVFNEEVFDARYNVLRRDRENTNSSKCDGGGVLVASLKKFQIVHQSLWETGIEDIWITLISDKHNVPNLNICICYLPPDINISKRDEFYVNCQKIMLHERPADNFLIIGDFNTPEFTMKPALDSVADKHCRKLLLLNEFMALCSLKQHNYVTNDKGRLLDLVLSNLDAITVADTCPLSKVDKHHPALDIEVKIDYKLKGLNKCARETLLFSKCNLQLIKADLESIPWHDILSTIDIDTCTDIFYKKLFEIIYKHTPTKISKPHTYPIWYSKSLIKCNEEKRKYHKLYKKYNNPRDYDTFSLLRTRCHKMATECYNRYLSSTEDSIGKNIKLFWRFVNNKKGKQTSIPCVMSMGDSTASGGQSICDLFSVYFGSVFELNNNANLLSSPINYMNSNMSDSAWTNVLSSVSFTEKDIIHKIRQLDGGKGAGPDLLPPSFIKSCAKELSIPLSIIFNKSLCSGIFPKRWKIAHITPILKSGDRSRCENYRPISILCCFAKLFESLVYACLYNHVKPIISDKQHGFVKNRSTVTNLLEYKNFLCRGFASSGQIDAIYTDFSKAFDKVNHTILCKKLAFYGIRGNLLRWISSYLSNRSQLVALKGYLSLPVSVSSGVPQGSHLGPLFFVLFINDLIERLACHCLLYADDLKIFTKIVSKNDCLALQSDLCTISDWCKINKMDLNISKCCVISFSNKRDKVIYNYTIEGQVLKRTTVVKDLGILFDDRLSFKPHYQHITTKANKVLGFVLRSTKGFKKSYSQLYLYFALVRSILEYGSPIWSPFYQVHINDIERVQKKCLKVLSYRQHFGRACTSYDERLSKFRVQSLEIRRKYFDLVYLYKIVHFMIDSSVLLSNITLNTKYSQRRSTRVSLFALHTYKNNISYYNPLVRMARQYNELVINNLHLDIFHPRLRIYINIVKDILYPKPHGDGNL